MYYDVYDWPSLIIWPKYTVQHTNLHRTQITNTSKYMMAKLQLAKLKGNPNYSLFRYHEAHVDFDTFSCSDHGNL